MKALSKERNSNFELLRIASMMLIVIHHFIITTERVDYATPALKGGEWLNAFTVVGVNCFLLISGYYGIKLKASKILFILYSVALVCGADYMLHTFFGSSFNLDYALRTIVPLSSKANWFIPAYIALMCFAPVVNRSLAGFSRKELTNSLLILTFVNFYAYATGVASINPNGYSLVQFVYLYILGHWLKDMRPLPIWQPFLAYVFFSLATGIVATVYKTGFTAFAYNSPFVLFSSVSFFLIFKGVKIESRWINRFAGATFTVFLFHYVILHYVKYLSKSHYSHKWLYVVGIYIAIFFTSFLLSEMIGSTWNFLKKQIVRLLSR